MLDQLSPALRQPMTALSQRWQTFQEKLQARVEAILTEANTGLDQLIAQHTTDPGPMGAAFSTLQARFHSLSSKLDEAWETLDNEIEETTDVDDLSDRDNQIAQELWLRWSREHSALGNRLDDNYHAFEVKKQADWARSLHTLARAEIERGVSCNTCGAPLAITVYWQASNVECNHCNSVSGYQPGAAAGLYFQGAGAHSLAQEQALAEWFTEQQAERTLKRYRFATSADHAAYMEAARAYHTKYYQALRDLHPGSPGALTTPEAAAAEKLKHYTAWDRDDENHKRAFLANLLAASQQQGQAALSEMLRNVPVGLSLGDCAFCLQEHGDNAGAQVALHLEYEQEGEDEPRAEWMREQLSDINSAIRTAAAS